MEIRVLFFGVLSQTAGTSFRTYSGVSSFSDLMLRIRDEFPEISHYKYRISHNSVLIINEPLLNEGDEVAFLPPFYGG